MAIDISGIATSDTGGTVIAIGTSAGTSAGHPPSSTAIEADAVGCANVPSSPAARIGGIGTGSAAAVGKFTEAAPSGLSFRDAFFGAGDASTAARAGANWSVRAFVGTGVAAVDGDWTPQLRSSCCHHPCIPRRIALL
jgi:hypothetical protein